MRTKKRAYPKASIIGRDDKFFTFLMITVFGTTLVVVPFIFDSFALPKLLFMSLGVMLIIAKLSLENQNLKHIGKFLYLSSFLFLISIFVSWLISGVPFTRALIGQYGRGNGLIYYFLAICIFLLACHLFDESVGSKLHLGLTLLAWLLSIYAIFQRLSLDFAELETRDLSPVVLTFGNSNFAGSMLSVLFAYHFTYATITRNFRFPQLSLLVTLLACSTLPAAVQGYLIIVLSAALAITSLIYNSCSSKISKTLLAIAWLSAFVLVVLGLLGKTILASVFSRQTFQIRIEYWKISLNVFRENPLFGVGPDKLYDYSSKYMAPGTLDLVSATRLDNAHNWFINVMTNYGILSFAFLLVILVWISFRAINIIFDKTNKSPWGKCSAIAFFAVLTSGMVSIEQPGIGIWLYFFGGIVIATHSQISLDSSSNSSKQNLPSLRLQSANRLVFVGAFVALVAITITLGNRIVLDGMLRSNIQTLAVGQGTPKTLIDIENLGKGLRSDPEYAVKALDVLAKLGAAKEIDRISSSMYEYDNKSIQANLIRANVLTALKRQQEACELFFFLLPNSPWDSKLLRNYLICLARDFEDPRSKVILSKASGYLEPFKMTALEASLENLSLLQQKAATASERGRLAFELGNRAEALIFANYARNCLAKILTIIEQNPPYEATPELSEASLLISFQEK